MRWSWIAFAMWQAAFASDIVRTDLLSRRVSPHVFHNQTRLAALVLFARENKVPLGIEYSGVEFDELINLSTPATDVRHALGSILGKSRRSVLASSGGAVSINSPDVPSPAWLDQHIALFSIRRTCIAFAAISLSMTVDRQLNRELRGFVGDFPPGDPADQVGPLEVRGATVRELLNHLVAASTSSSWVVTRPNQRVVPPAVINLLWTTMYRANPMDELPPIPLPHMHGLNGQ